MGWVEAPRRYPSDLAGYRFACPELGLKGSTHPAVLTPETRNLSLNIAGARYSFVIG